jgi:hypothetical protein
MILFNVELNPESKVPPISAPEVPILIGSQLPSKTLTVFVRKIQRDSGQYGQGYHHHVGF